VAGVDTVGPALAEHTTLRLGGPARRLTVAATEAEIIQSARAADTRSEPMLIIAGGSNLVVADAGFDGEAVLLRTTGVTVRRDGEDVLVAVAAGESWDGIVARGIAEGWSGLECLSGIPGSAGATPMQNVGAYGREVAELITAVRVYDRHTDATVTMRPRDCGFGYRTSIFRGVPRWIVLSVEFRLALSTRSAPVRYEELARALDVPIGDRVPAADVRAAVLKLRAGKGMVLDAGDPDTYSAGSFFTNPVLDGPDFEALSARAATLGSPAPSRPPAWPNADGTVKTSAAWLIERAGFTKGYGNDAVAISGKHTLALTNRGSGTTEQLLKLAREIRDGVRDRFGIELHPEPILVNCAL
jgi:UDP-N-acetylmuramate dehydrogenase